MPDFAIRVENLSKRCRIGLKEEMHDTMVGAMTDFVRRPLQNLRRLTHFCEDGDDPEGIIWALKEVSFEVERGEVVGIPSTPLRAGIGRNGAGTLAPCIRGDCTPAVTSAGESTLLKILSHITEPTNGRVEIRGRVSSLLDASQGHRLSSRTDWPGRRAHLPQRRHSFNKFRTGLGMKKAEIDRKFDEIVDFSGVERFIDTPVKRREASSGMRVRLVFSVAGHRSAELTARPGAGDIAGGREKAPAAICRKVAESEDGGMIKVWGNVHMFN